MDDPTASQWQTGTAAGRWLLLFHQLPPKPDYLRVKVRRRLQKIGAVLLKNSLYVLPNTPESLEDFQWLRREITHDGGDATICAVGFLEGVTDAELEEMFRQASDQVYQALAVAARSAAAEAGEADVERLRRQLSEAVERDFFAASQRMKAERAVAALAERVVRDSQRGPAPESAPPRPQGATWVTRQGVHIDRIASAWLIRRFLDPAARFKFASAQGYSHAPEELRFDMFEGEFTHEGDHCTFETLLARFGLSDPALHAIAQVVHDIDCKDERFGRDEVPGVASVIRGITLTHPSDAARLAAGAAVIDGLYAQFSSAKPQRS